MDIDELLEKPYWIVDILPKQVAKNSNGQYFAIEQYYLREPQSSELRKKYAHLILKLNCYYDILVLSSLKTQQRRKLSQMAFLSVQMSRRKSSCASLFPVFQIQVNTLFRSQNKG